MRKRILSKLFKPKSERDFNRHRGSVAEINRFAESFAGFGEADFAAKTGEFKQRIADGTGLGDILPEAYGLVKAGCRWLVGQSWDVCGIEVTWEMVPYDVQLVGGIVLQEGGIAEMATGEGKTLVATMPMYLN
ncbi:MAG: preprotein translocase subunit SecA, partial [Candidatus Krumholzibacteriia bacterium]